MNLGIMIDNLMVPDLCLDILSASSKVKMKIFATNPKIPQQLPVPVFSLKEAYNFDGPIIATSIDGAIRLTEVLENGHSHYFYSWFLWWHRIPGDFNFWHSIYNNSKYKTIVRSEGHKQVVDKVFNTKCQVMSTLSELIQWHLMSMKYKTE